MGVLTGNPFPVSCGLRSTHGQPFGGARLPDHPQGPADARAGRPAAGASSGVLEALARALHLDETERVHLYDLARAADGIPASGRPRRRTATKAAARLSLRWALEAITD